MKGITLTCAGLSALLVAGSASSETVNTLTTPRSLTINNQVRVAISTTAVESSNTTVRWVPAQMIDSEQVNDTELGELAVSANSTLKKICLTPISGEAVGRLRFTRETDRQELDAKIYESQHVEVSGSAGSACIDILEATKARNASFYVEAPDGISTGIWHANYKVEVEVQ